jgi:hypothetical protein
VDFFTKAKPNLSDLRLISGLSVNLGGVITQVSVRE